MRAYLLLEHGYNRYELLLFHVYLRIRTGGDGRGTHATSERVCVGLRMSSQTTSMRADGGAAVQ